MPVSSLPLYATGDTIEAVIVNTLNDSVNLLDARTGGDPGAAGKLLLASGSLAASWLAAGSAGLPLVSNGSTPSYAQVGTAGIADDAVTNGKLATDSVGSAQILANAVGSSELASGAVVTDKITDGNVTTGKLASGAVTTDKILNANVTADKLASNSVQTAKIVDGNVTTVKIADANVTTAKIADGNVTEGKLASNSVTAAKIVDATITDTEVAAANKDGAAGTASMRTLGTGATQAAAGTHTHAYARIASGNYNGTSGAMAETGVGFTPTIVHIVNSSGAAFGWGIGSDLVWTVSPSPSSGATQAGAISMDADGFSFSASNGLNVSGQQYFYVAFG